MNAESGGRFVPPFPDPKPRKSSLILRFVRGWQSWIHVLFEKSYTMKMGEIRTPGMRTYIANELPLVKRILDDYHAFPKHSSIVRLLGPAIGNSLFSANGTDWEEQRAMVKPVFQHTALGRTLPLMRDAADDVVTRLRAMDLTRPIDIDPLMTHVAADVIFRTLFSITLDGERARAIHDGFARFQRHAQSASMLRHYRLPTLGYDGRSVQAARQIRGAFEAIVRERYDRFHRRGERPHDDILQGLLEAQHPTTGEPFTVTGVMDQVSTIFLAGHETSASAMCWSLYLLAEDRPTQDAVRAEIADAALSAETLRGANMLRNVFREALRLYPPVAFLPREVTGPTRMRDKDLVPGAMLIVAPWLIQRNRDHWPCPHAFDPARFDDPACKASVKDAYLPFGQGPRVCVGAGFATQEAMVVVATMLRAFDLSAVDGDKPEPVSRLTLRPKNGLRLYLSPR
jgi:cytochrome P450